MSPDNTPFHLDFVLIIVIHTDTADQK